MSERSMEQYLKAVRRGLQLEREARDRVMADLARSIAERREAGQTDAEIAAELGAPEKVAAELNEQMQEHRTRKSPWRFLFLAGAIYAAIELLGNLVAHLMMRAIVNDSASVGIIGGADGPTAIFVTSGPRWTALWYLLLLAVGVVGFLKLRKCRKK